MAEAIKNRDTAITNGWADINAILVAAEADAHKMAKKIPARTSVRLYPLLCLINWRPKILIYWPGKF